MEDAEAQLYRRIQELRARARGMEGEPEEATPAAEPRQPVPDLRTILARAERHVEELRQTAGELQTQLPASVEQAVERAMAGRDDATRFDALHVALGGLQRQVEQVNRDLLAERLGRVEDLELVVDLISTGMAELRKDTAALAALLDRTGDHVELVLDKLDQPLQVTVERPQRAGVRDLFTPTDTGGGPRPA
jgi:chromosome segregation ATPase